MAEIYTPLGKLGGEPTVQASLYGGPLDGLILVMYEYVWDVAPPEAFCCRLANYQIPDSFWVNSARSLPETKFPIVVLSVGIDLAHFVAVYKQDHRLEKDCIMAKSVANGATKHGKNTLFHEKTYKTEEYVRLYT